MSLHVIQAPSLWFPKAESRNNWRATHMNNEWYDDRMNNEWRTSEEQVEFLF